MDRRCNETASDSKGLYSELCRLSSNDEIVLLCHAIAIYHRAVLYESIHPSVLSSHIPPKVVRHMHDRNDVYRCYIRDDLPFPHCFSMHSNRLILGQVFKFKMRQPNRHHIFWRWFCNFRARRHDLTSYSVHTRVEN